MKFHLNLAVHFIQSMKDSTLINTAFTVCIPSDISTVTYIKYREEFPSVVDMGWTLIVKQKPVSKKIFRITIEIMVIGVHFNPKL